MESGNAKKLDILMRMLNVKKKDPSFLLTSLLLSFLQSIYYIY